MQQNVDLIALLLMEKQWKISNNDKMLLLDELYNMSAETKPDTIEKPTISRSIEICIVLDNEPSTQTSQFISKVMQSVNKSEDDFHVLWNKELDDIATEAILRFGISEDPDSLYVVAEHNGIKTCAFDAIDAIMTDTSKKRHLWECLKTMFGLSQN